MGFGSWNDPAVYDPTGQATLIAIMKGLMFKQVPSSATYTRLANTTAYAALDAISDHATTPTGLTFANMVRSAGGCGTITKARLLTNLSTCVARLVLHLYTVAPTPINDNAAFTLLWANRANRIGSLVFPGLATEGTGSDCSYSMLTPGYSILPLDFVCAAGSTSIYGLLETLDAFTPASEQVIYLELMGLVS